VNTPPAQRRAGESNPAGSYPLPPFQGGCAPCFSLSIGWRPVLLNDRHLD